MVWTDRTTEFFSTMSTSLRDQLLKAGLINQQQANEAERQQDRRQRQQMPRRPTGPANRAAPGPTHPTHPTPARPAPARPAATGSAAARSPVAAPAAPTRAPFRPTVRDEKALRDLKLNQQKTEKAEKKARAAQLRQLIEQHRLPSIEGGELYNFIDTDKVRCVRVDADRRGRIVSGELAIVRHAGLYAVVPAAIVPRIRERDPQAIVTPAPAPDAAPTDDGYAQFPVPDDLVW
jgi:uncharacterized protein YaiL (DUF2058 family)